MFREWLSSPPSKAAFLILLVLLIKACDAWCRNNTLCVPSSCGVIRNISYPFRQKTDPEECGCARYTLSCESNKTVLYLFAGKYYVQEINYHNYTIRLVDAGVLKDDCSTLPILSLASGNFTWAAYEEQGLLHPEDETVQRLPYEPGFFSNYELIIFVNCANPQSSDGYPQYVDAGGCKPSSNINNSSLSSSTKDMHSYVFVSDYYDRDASQLMDLCSVEKVVMGAPLVGYETQYVSNYTSFEEIHSTISRGFELSWINIYCDDKCWDCYPGADGVMCEQDNGYRHFRFGHIWALKVSGRAWQQKGFRGKLHRLYLNIYARLPIVGFLWGITQGAKFVLGAPCIIALLIYKWRRRHLSAYDAIEDFLQSHNNLTPIRYSYSHIKKMTTNFRDKLGGGGFGSVYKGKLRSGCIAAIKMLDKSQANGQEFISEVATIGRIRHVNVVQLIGFCSERSKRALVYEFMPNGSLDKYIFDRKESISLSWKKLFEISLGVARGIQYLHEGCDMQILHFDIKPHNILLDENFIPKVSDFGLARLYQTNDSSIASLTAARGTIGYMAPELFYKNIGRVSHKADVYSFGMLLLDMAGRRKNLSPVTEKSSQIYFPFCVHDQVSKGEVTEIGNATEEEMEMVKKMIIVGLWCIQMKPTVRPLMRKVVEMLEGDLESLPLPPRPVLYPEENMAKVETGESSTTDSCSESFSSSKYASSSLDAKELADDM